MTDLPFAAVVLAAGMGTRMKSRMPKVLHPLAGQPMIRHLMGTLDRLGPERGVMVVGPDMEDLSEVVSPWPTVVQTDRLGTADAVKPARPLLEDFVGTVLVLFGDSPLITAATMQHMLAARAGENAPAVVVLAFRPDDPQEYGRLVVAADGSLDAIVENREATAEQRAINLCNSGVMAVDGRRLWNLLDRVDNNNAKGEYYLTDLVALARADGLTCAVVEGTPEELLGINSRADLALAESVLQAELRNAAMDDGATLIDPETVWFSHDTQLGRDVVVHPNVVFGPGVSVADGVEIHAFSHLEGAQVGSGARVGPYARLRPGASLQAKARVGNFVEVKNAVLGEGAKANHLSYIGDGSIGAGANIGAGTIFCNYDGFQKHQTVVGARAFVGSNSALVAPVTIGDGAMVASGSTINRDVEPDAMAIGRGRQVEKAGWAAEFRAKQSGKD